MGQERLAHWDGRNDKVIVANEARKFVGGLHDGLGWAAAGACQVARTKASFANDVTLSKGEDYQRLRQWVFAE
jgi:hypothetical protein